MKAPIYNTREAWLEAALENLREKFTKVGGLDLPERLKVSTGWPIRGGGSAKKRVIGECWKSEAAADGIVQIFISPWLSEPLAVLETLVHELIHAALPEAKHGADFKAAMKKVGLVGKATATNSGDDLRAELSVLAEKLGDYDNGKLGLSVPADSPKPQKNRQKRIICPKASENHDSGVDYILRASKKVIDLGLPTCPLCGEQLEAELDEDTDGQGD